MLSLEIGTISNSVSIPQIEAGLGPVPPGSNQSDHHPIPLRFGKS